MFISNSKLKLKTFLKDRKKKGKKIALNLDYQIGFDRRIKEEISLIKNYNSLVLIAPLPKWQFKNLIDITDNLRENTLLMVSSGFATSKFTQKIRNLLHISNTIFYYLEALYLLLIMRPEIVIIHDLPAYRLVASTILMIRKVFPFYKFKIFYDAHELYASQRDIEPIWQKIEQKAIKQADKIICVCEEQLDYYKNYLKNIEIQKFVILDNGINYQRIDPYFEKIIEFKSKYQSGEFFPRSMYGWDDPKKHLKNYYEGAYKRKITRTMREKNKNQFSNQNIRLVYAGNTSLLRNLHNVIWAIDEANLHYESIGENNTKLIFSIFTSEVPKEFFQICNELAYPERIIFNSLIPQNILINHFIKSDIGILPYVPLDTNTIMCKPNKMFEFIYAKLPFIYDANLDGIQKDISELEGEFAFSTNMQFHEEISRKLIQVIDSEIYKKSVQNINSSYKKFDLKTRSQKYIQMFK